MAWAGAEATSQHCCRPQPLQPPLRHHHLRRQTHSGGEGSLQTRCPAVGPPPLAKPRPKSLQSQSTSLLTLSLSLSLSLPPPLPLPTRTRTKPKTRRAPARGQPRSKSAWLCAARRLGAAPCRPALGWGCWATKSQVLAAEHLAAAPRALARRRIARQSPSWDWSGAERRGRK